MSEERIQRMARLYVEQGLSYEAIGEEYGLTRQRVGQLLTPLGLAKTRGPAARARREQNLQAAHAEIVAGEKTHDAAAAELGYANGESLRHALRDIGLTFSTRTIPEHGTIARYTSRSHQCRCEECRRANRERAQRLRLTTKDPPEHGRSGYKNYGCRCQVCTEANRLYVRTRRVAKRQRREVTI